MLYWYPAVVTQYIPEKHRARVNIFGLTDGNTGIYPEAEIAYAIGDIHGDTETLIQTGDEVWITFAISGDARIPIIVAYRNPPSGNMVGTRRFRQKNIEIIATDTVKIEAPNIIVQSSNTKLDHAQLTATGTNTLQGQTNLDGGATTTSGSAPVISGGIKVQGGTVEHDGTDIGKTHVHITGQPGSETSAPV